jgi:hypothetical protein
MPSPGWQVLTLVAMMNTFRPCVSYATTCKLQDSNYGSHSECLKPKDTPTPQNDCRRSVAAKLVNIAHPLDGSQVPAFHQSGPGQICLCPEIKVSSLDQLFVSMWAIIMFETSISSLSLPVWSMSGRRRHAPLLGANGCPWSDLSIAR